MFKVISCLENEIERLDKILLEYLLIKKDSEITILLSFLFSLLDHIYR